MNGKKIYIIFAIIAIFIAFGVCVAFRIYDFSFFNFAKSPKFEPEAKNESIMLYIPSHKAEYGQIDLSDVDFFTENSDLTGDWWFWAEEILTPAQVENKIWLSTIKQCVSFPQFLPKHNIFQSGFSYKNLVKSGTFALEIILPDTFAFSKSGAPKIGLLMEPVAADFCIFANSTLLFESKNNPQANIIDLSPAMNGNNRLLLTIQVNNFAKSANICHAIPQIALYSKLQTRRTIGTLLQSLLSGAFFAMFLYCIIKILQNKQEKSYIPLAVASIFSIFAIGCTADSLFVQLVAPNAVFYRICSTANMLLPFIIYAVVALFLFQSLKENIKKTHIYSVLLICGICAVSIVALPQGMASAFAPVFGIFAFVCVILLFFVSVKIAKAKINASRLIAASCVLILAAQINDFLLDFYIIKSVPVLPPAAFFSFVLLCIYRQSNFYATYTALQGYSADLYKINKSLDRFIPVDLLKRINAKSLNNVHLGDSVQMPMTVMVLKVKHFNLRAQHMQSVDAFGFLNELWAYLVPAIKQNVGAVAKYNGHGLIAVFENQSDSALLAVRGINENLANFNARLAQLASGEEEVRLSIGIHAGQVMLGTIGEESCMETTTIGETIDIARQIETLTETFDAPVLVSAQAVQALKNRDNFRLYPAGQKQMPGMQSLLTAFKLEI